MNQFFKRASLILLAASLLVSVPGTNLLAKDSAGEFLDYDIETGAHRTAVEEWVPHKVQSPNFVEWHYWTSILEGENGHRYFLAWVDMNFSSEVHTNYVKSFIPNFMAPEDKLVHSAFVILSDYTADRVIAEVDLAVLSEQDYLDFQTNTIRYRSPRYQSEWSYDGDKVQLQIKGPEFSLNIDATGGEKVLWAKDKLGVHGFIQEGAPEDRSFYYSIPNLRCLGTLTVNNADGSTRAIQVSGRGWIDRQWGEYLTKSWEWSSFRFADGESINLYKFWNGYQVGSYQKADGSCEYFNDFKVIQNGYAKAPDNTWFTWGWSYELPVKGKMYKVVPMSSRDVLLAPANTLYEGAGRLLDEDGNQVGWAVNESMDVRVMQNAPYGKHQGN